MKNKRNTQYSILNTKRIAVMFFLILLWLLLPQAKALAATYYVDIDGVGEDGILGTADDVISSDANPGTAEQPWKTLNRAYTWYSGSGTKVVGGDTVYFKGGNYGAYYEKTAPSPARTDWITYKAASGSLPILQWIRISFADANAYLKFDGFTIEADGSAPLGIGNFAAYRCYVYSRADYLDFNNLTIKGRGHLAYGSTEVGMGFDGTEHLTVQNCLITPLPSVDTNKDAGFTYGIMDWSSYDSNYVNTVVEYCWSGIRSYNNNKLNFKNCTVRYCFRQGFQIAGGNDITVDGCTVHSMHPLVFFVDANGATYTDSNKTVTAAVGAPYDPTWGGVDSRVRLTDANGNIIIPASSVDSGGYWFTVDSATTTTIVLHTAIGKDYSLSKVEYHNTHGPGLFHIIQYGLNNLIVRNSKFYNTANTGVNFQASPSIISTNWTIENNLIYGGCWWNPHYTASCEFSGINSISHVIFRNNTIIGELRGGSAQTFDVFEGNIIKWIGVNTQSTSFGKEDYNIWGRRTTWDPYNMTGYVKGSHTLELGDSNNYGAFKSLFVDYDNNDFTPAAISPSVDFMPLDKAPNTDLEGKLREDISGVGNDGSDYADAGCYEYGASTFLYGDVSGNGEISSYDAALTAQAAVGLITLTPEQIKAADVSGNGEVSAYDAALIAQKAVGLIEKFPVEE